jgi:hypothetical protein
VLAGLPPPTHLYESGKFFFWIYKHVKKTKQLTSAIEPAQFWLKRRTTQQGSPKTRAAMKKVWYEAWEDLPQEQIQTWIIAIPQHI